MQQSGLPQTSALLCFIFVVSVSYGTSACGNDYCTSLGDHISFLSILSPHKQRSTALPRFMATHARGLTSQAVNLTHTTHWSECLMYYVANACSNRHLCNWRVNSPECAPEIGRREHAVQYGASFMGVDRTPMPECGGDACEEHATARTKTRQVVRPAAAQAHAAEALPMPVGATSWIQPKGSGRVPYWMPISSSKSRSANGPVPPFATWSVRPL